MADLFILRHAKSDWSADLPDFQRGLNPRGHQSCPVMAERLLHHKISPEAILLSPATRCVQTLDGIQKAGALSNLAVQAVQNETLYLADFRTIAAEIGGLAEQTGAQSIILFGHNPGLTDLIWVLAGDEEATAKSIPPQIPTASLCWLEVPDLTALAKRSATIKLFETPRQFYDF